VTYNVGDLLIFNDLFSQQTYTGIITHVIKDDSSWSGGGYYILHWEYPDNYDGIEDNKASFDLVKVWVKNGEAAIYPAIR
jgi:hypothetical protein